MALKPGDFLNCPIAHDIFEEAVQTNCKHNYSKEELESWLNTNSSCPECRTAVEKADIVYHKALQKEANKWKANPNTYKLPEDIEDISRNQASKKKVYPDEQRSGDFEEDYGPSLRLRRVYEEERREEGLLHEIGDGLDACCQEINACCREVEEGVDSCCDGLSDCCLEFAPYIALAGSITALAFSAYTFGVFDLIGRTFASVVSYIPNPMQLFLYSEF